MKARMALVTAGSLTLLVAAVLLTSASPTRQVHAAGGGCPASYAQGFFGFSGDSFDSSGFVPKAKAVVGEIFLTADAGTTTLTGTIGGFATFNNRGVITRVTLTGTYVMVANECNGSATIIPVGGTAMHYDLVPTGWAANGGIAQEDLFVGTDPQNVGTLDAISM